MEETSLRGQGRKRSNEKGVGQNEEGKRQSQRTSQAQGQTNRGVTQPRGEGA